MLLHLICCVLLLFPAVLSSWNYCRKRRRHDSILHKVFLHNLESQVTEFSKSISFVIWKDTNIELFDVLKEIQIPCYWKCVVNDSSLYRASRVMFSVGWLKPKQFTNLFYVFAGQKLLDTLAETWDFFFSDVLPMLQAIFYPVQVKNYTVTIESWKTGKSNLTGSSTDWCNPKLSLLGPTFHYSSSVQTSYANKSLMQTDLKCSGEKDEEELWK